MLVITKVLHPNRLFSIKKLYIEYNKAYFSIWNLNIPTLIQVLFTNF